MLDSLLGCCTEKSVQLAHRGRGRAPLGSHSFPGHKGQYDSAHDAYDQGQLRSKSWAPHGQAPATGWAPSLPSAQYGGWGAPNAAGGETNGGWNSIKSSASANNADSSTWNTGGAPWNYTNGSTWNTAPAGYISRQLGGHLFDTQEDAAPLSARSAASCASSCASMGSAFFSRREPDVYAGRDQREVRQIVKVCSRELVDKGADISVVATDGKLTSLRVYLNHRLDNLRMIARGKSRNMPLSKVARVYIGAAPELMDLATPLDERCVTFELKNGECLTFSSPDRLRDSFGLTLKLLVDAGGGPRR